MKKINILKENKDFEKIIKNNKPFKYKGYMVFYEFDQNEKNYKFGISVSKKIANAVGRNKIKRQLKSMIDKNIYKKGIKCIIIVRKSYLENDFNQNEIDLNYILDKIKIKGEANEKK